MVSFDGKYWPCSCPRSYVNGDANSQIVWLFSVVIQFGCGGGSLRILLLFFLSTKSQSKLALADIGTLPLNACSFTVYRRSRILKGTFPFFFSTLRNARSRGLLALTIVSFFLPHFRRIFIRSQNLFIFTSFNLTPPLR